MDIALQFDFNGLKLGPDFLNVVLQLSLDLLKVGLDFVNVMFQFGPEFLKFVCKGELKVFFGDQVLVKVGLPSGKDFGLVFGHAGAGQALDVGVSVEGDLRLHGR